MKNPLPYEISKIGWRGYTIQFSQYHIIIKSPEGYLRYELPRKYNTTQDAMDTIDEDIKISKEFHK